MTITAQLQQQLQQLTAVLEKITKVQYTFKSTFLSNATIGAHTRHIIELLQCTITGYDIELIDYVHRERNFEIEQNKELALSLIKTVQNNIYLKDKILFVLNDDGSSICSSFNRELVYNVEHIIHHLALIKVALIELNENIVDDNFGFAYATIQYKQQLQQS